MAMVEKELLSRSKEGEIAVVVNLSTGLALKRTKPRRVPQRYLDGPIKEVLSYLLRTIEQEGDDDEAILAANIQDHMSSRQYIVRMNGSNVNPDNNFGALVEKLTQVEDAGESEKGSMKYREVNLVVTRVEEGGK